MPKRFQKFIYATADGGTIVMKARIRAGLKHIVLPMTADYVRSAARKHGEGDASRCAGALCAIDHKDKFDHPVLGPMVWADSTVFVLSEVTKSGHPKLCYGYEHKHSEISKLFDQGKRGQRKLIRMIEKKGGTIWVTLKPKRFRLGETKSGGQGRQTGERTPRVNNGGAIQKRFVRARAGLTPL